MANYIEATDLEAAIKQESLGKIVVVDVRDEDFAGGNIAGAVNAPSEEWGSEIFIANLADQISSADVVVFHCMHSKVRGPFCANLMSEKLLSLSHQTL